MVSWIRHLRAFSSLPFVVTVIIPTTLFYLFPSSLLVSSSSFWLGYLDKLGIMIYGIGLSLLIQTNILFHHQGNGTLAPFDPPTKFVVSGLYFHSRNPMILGVFFMLAGEALFFNSRAIGYWLLFFILAKNIYLKLHEEPELIQRFGDSYRR